MINFDEDIPCIDLITGKIGKAVGFTITTDTHHIKIGEEYYERGMSDIILAKYVKAVFPLQKAKREDFKAGFTIYIKVNKDYYIAFNIRLRGKNENGASFNEPYESYLRYITFLQDRMSQLFVKHYKKDPPKEALLL